MKKKIKLTMTMIMAVCLCASSAIFAADGTRLPANGDWSASGSWVGGVVPGAGDTANFTNNTTVIVDTLIDVDTTIKDINVNDGDGTENTYDVEDGAGSLTLAGGSTIDCATRLNLKCVVAGTEGFTKTGAGVMNIGATSNIISGTVNLNGTGDVVLNNKDALMNADVVVATKVLSRKSEFNANSIVVNSGGKIDISANDVPANPVKILADSITINNGGLLEPTLASVVIAGSPITIASGGMIQPNISCSIYNDLTIAGTGGSGYLGAIDSRSNNQTVNISNITLSANAQIGALSIGNVINLLGDIDGTGQLTIWGQAGAVTHPISFNIQGSNIFSGTTALNSASAKTTIKLFGPQRFPNNSLAFNNANNFGETTIDLNGNDQKFGWTAIGGPVKKVIKDSAGGGTLSFIDKDINGDYVMGIESGTLLVESGNVYCDKFVYIRNGASLVVTAGTFKCDLELMPGHAGSASTVTVSDDGIINAFVCRNGDADDASTFNLNDGGVLKTAGMYASGSTPSIIETSYLNFDGGTLSDGTWPIWNSEWIQTFTNLIVKAGGAKIEVNNSSGRTISFALLHDPALGGTADGGLTKLGSETLTLGGNNTYTGPTVVKAGTLAINGSITASSGITIDPDAAIGGTGTLPAMTIPSGATVSPGNSIGTLSTSGNLTLASGSEYDWEVDLNNADLLDVDGTLIIGGSMIVNVIDAGSPDGSTLTLATATSISGNPNDITLSYASGVGGPNHPSISGNDLVADIIPEPATFGLLAILGLAFLRKK